MAIIGQDCVSTAPKWPKRSVIVGLRREMELITTYRDKLFGAHNILKNYDHFSVTNHVF